MGSDGKGFFIASIRLSQAACLRLFAFHESLGWKMKRSSDEKIKLQSVGDDKNIKHIYWETKGSKTRGERIPLI